MTDPLRPYMTKEPEIDFFDQPISQLSVEALAPFADADGNFTKSFDVTIKGHDFLREIWVLSAWARYQSANGEKPLIQVRLIDAAGTILYYAPPYVIGHQREMYRKEWRIPPIIDRFDTVRISFIIPEGVVLTIREIRHKANTRYREGDYGIRFHAHAGFPGYASSNTAFSFQISGEMGFTSCITIPKFTKDGIGVCFHDDASIIKEVRYDDGSFIEPGSADDKPIYTFTYEELMKFDKGPRKSDIYAGTRIPTMDEFFRICAATGMSPIFSIHPSLTHDQWLYVKDLLEKYRLLDKFWIKSGNPKNNLVATKIFDDKIAGYIMIQSMKDDWDPAEQAAACGIDPSRHNVVVEFFYRAFTEEKLQKAKAAGFNKISIATTDGGISGPSLEKLIDMGISEFTIDHHCSMGLDW